MNNFFFDASDYSLFKKALKITDNEPVVINILSDDSSLQSQETKNYEQTAARKNMSKKYEPSPFGKFFGPRRPQNVSVDMKDFSSWKNKNYRKAEETINDTSLGEVKFSMSDFMNDKSQHKFNELDQTKSDMQKPINQLSTDDPLYKKFSLDSYMHKLEEQTMVKGQFEENDDILEPLGDKTQSVVPDSSQDENFGFGSTMNVEKLAFDDPIEGSSFKFEQEELDKFRARLDKIEREAAHIKEKSTQKVISTNELSDISGGFNLDNLTEGESSLTDDVERVNKTLSDNNGIIEESDAPKSKKTFFEINKTESTSKRSRPTQTNGLLQTFEETEDDKQDINDDLSTETLDDVDDSANVETLEEPEEVVDADLGDEETLETEEQESSESQTSEFDVDEDLEDDLNEEDEEQSNIDGIDAVDIEPSKITFKTARVKKTEAISQDDFDDLSEDITAKFTGLTKKQSETIVPSYGEQGVPFGGGYAQDPNMFIYTDPSFVSQGTYAPSTNDENQQLKAQLQELIDSNKKLDLEKQQRLQEAEIEKERVAAEYESRIKEMEKSFKQNYEDFKKQAYLDKLDRDIKLKEAESKFKKKTVEIKEQEKASYSKEKTGAMLRKELRNNLNISNLEMDKKLLEVASKLNKDQYDKLNAEKLEMAKKLEAEEEARLQAEEAAAAADEQDIEEDEVEETSKKSQTTKKKTTRKRKTTTPAKRSTRKGSRRKIDSDIIGGIDFE